jgi:hypothetical protein
MRCNPNSESASQERVRLPVQCQHVHDEPFPQLQAVMTNREQVDAMVRELPPASVAEPALSGA